MAVQREITEPGSSTLAANILDEAVLVVLSPIVVPALLLGLRPVAKMTIKGGLWLLQGLQQLVTATSDLFAEACAETRLLTPPAPAESRVTQAPPLAQTTWRSAVDTDTTVGEVVADPPPPTEATDLLRLTGIGRRFAALLCAAGVASTQVLARRNPSNLHARLIQVNAEQHIVSQAPSLEQVSGWIAQAQNAVI